MRANLTEMQLVVDMWLSANGRSFSLPAGGSRSMLFRFDTLPGQPLFGAMAVDPSGVGFSPGVELKSVELWMWAHAEASAVMRTGLPFVVWYGGDIGGGEVLQVLG